MFYYIREFIDFFRVENATAMIVHGACSFPANVEKSNVIKLYLLSYKFRIQSWKYILNVKLYFFRRVF